MPKSYDIFSDGELLDEEQTHKYLEENVRSNPFANRGAEPGYVEERRLLLGPVADITHDDFLRPNRPDETFQVYYDRNGLEHIYDHKGNKVEL